MKQLFLEKVKSNYTIIIQALRVNILIWEYIPVVYQTKKVFMEALNGSFFEWNQHMFPRLCNMQAMHNLVDDKEVVLAMLKSEKTVHSSLANYSGISERLKGDLGFSLEAIEYAGAIGDYLSPGVRSNPLFIKKEQEVKKII